MKYIDAEKLTKAIEDKGLDCSFALKIERLDTLALIDELQQEQPSLPDNLKLNMTRTELELNEIETLTHLVRAKAVEPGPFQGLYKGILSKLNKMFDEEYAERERKEE